MLCICKNIPKDLERHDFEIGKVYRVCDGENGWKFVNGMQMIGYLYKDNFISLAPEMVKIFKKLHMLKEDGSPLSKTAFKQRASIHKYGKYKIFHFYCENPKELMTSFYPMNGNVTDQVNECYEYYLSILNGDVTPIDDKDVQIGNSGIPIGYGDIGFRHTTILDLKL
jgi:hypothetical protein